MPHFVQNKYLAYARRCLLLMVLALFSSVYVIPAFAQSGINVTTVSPQSMLTNLEQQVPNLMRLATAVAYVVGWVLVIQGIMKMKHLGESRTMMSQEHSVTGPVVSILIGSMLIYLPSTVWMGMSTFWVAASPYSYLEQQDQWSQTINILFEIIQLIGVISFIRGLIILSRLGHHGGQPGTFGKGLTHIIGGIMAINIYQFIQVINATLGISFTG